MLARSSALFAILFVLAGPPGIAAPTELWLTAADGVEVRGDLYTAKGDAAGRPVVLLFHQAGSNRGEYATIAPRLNALGFDALAIDQRSGGERWGVRNETVERLGKSADYLEALPDLEAALAWKERAGYEGPTIVWGSSYSAALVFLLAARHGDRIDALLSFSPGEYLGTRTDEVSEAAAHVSLPVLILAPEEERERAEPIRDAVAAERKELVVPARAVHGSSMLIEERNPGAAEIWPVVERFLAGFAK